MKLETIKWINDFGGQNCFISFYSTNMNDEIIPWEKSYKFMLILVFNF